MVDWSIDGGGSTTAVQNRPSNLVNNLPVSRKLRSKSTKLSAPEIHRVRKVVDGKVYHVRVKKVKR
mgnify:FL=1